jgi:hypothetical protein
MIFSTNSTPPEWTEVWPTIEKLAQLPGISLHACAEILQCELKLIITNRFESHDLATPFKSVDIRKKSAKAGIIVLYFQPGPHLEFYAQAIKGMGDPLDINIVSPPIADPLRPVNLAWDSKYSWCFEICQRKIWFGFEGAHGAEKLVSVALHFDT